MSVHDGDRPLTGEHEDERNPYASSTRWRHQESSAYARHASHAQARDPVTAGHTGDLASFLNKSRVEPDGDGVPGGNAKPLAVAAGEANGGFVDENVHAEIPDGKEIVCGPLLNYRHMKQGRWHGSVLVVVKGGGKQPPEQPYLVLRRAGHSKQSDATTGQIDGPESSNHASSQEEARFEASCLYSDPRNTFWAFSIDVPIESYESNYEYEVPGLHYSSSHKPRVNNFFVPAATESMRIMFHSCNGFSVGTDEEAWSGPALWNDVVRKHKERPFHVMVGGGDQIYNDGIRVDGPLRKWTDIGNPKKRREYPFPETLRADCDDYYLKNYLRWYNTEPFSTANGQIPQLNIWDDHDVRCCKKRIYFVLTSASRSLMDLGLMLTASCDATFSAVLVELRTSTTCCFSIIYHHRPLRIPQVRLLTRKTWWKALTTTDHSAMDEETQGADPNQTAQAYIAPMKSGEQYILGPKPGPYVAEHSYNMYTRLGARIALVGIDARTEVS